jgi:formylglycine-generating enzyme required for sulfatase activity
MVEVEGDYCPWVEQICLHAVDPRHPEEDRCAEFAATGPCLGQSTPKHFCIDRYEWPNREGDKPVVAVNWDQARDQCAVVGKRLCTDTEWTVACEGQERLPYPYGYARNAAACNIDRRYIRPDEVKLADAHTRQEEIARLDQRDPSGARESCLSPYGVFDMTGNVDEWVVNESAHPYLSGLKGGYWGPVRDRCRPMTIDHNQWYVGYQVGFRCCSDAHELRSPTAPPAPPLARPSDPSMATSGAAERPGS